jgi:glycosyltransferase involved in cell wall biosynthesis
MKLFFVSLIFVTLLFVIAFSMLHHKERFENEEEKNFEVNLSLLCLIKNETMNLKVFIEHYIKQGVDRFYIVDNGSEDNPLEILQPYIDNGYVRYFNMPERYNQPEKYRQIIAQENLAEKTNWLIICDADEFFYGVPKKLSVTLKDDFAHADYVQCNWRMFGSSGLKEHPESILKSIVHRQENLHKEKYIFKPRKITDLNNIAVHEINESLNGVTENDKVRLNHYVIQSLEYYEKIKMKRGDVAHPSADSKHNMDFFNSIDSNAIVLDDTLANMQ